MSVSSIFKSYFNGFEEISNYKKNDTLTNMCAFLKILSYATGGIPAIFAALYSVTSLAEETASLCGRICSTKGRSSTDLKMKECVAKSSNVGLADVLNTYDPHFKPKANAHNLAKYSTSKDYQRHAKTACIYYNGNQLSKDDALQVVFQREPTNIAMESDQYNEKKLGQLFGYKKGVYNDQKAKKQDGSSFQDLPNSAAVYSETYLWDPPGGNRKKEVACLSFPAPALDSEKQPHYDYYMESGELNTKRYAKEMKFLFKCIERALRDHHKTAFGNKGIKRVVLSKFGQGAFLAALSGEDRKAANKAYKKELGHFLDRVEDLGIEVVMSEYSDPGRHAWHDNFIVGDILETAEPGDLIVNAWDPHSAPGNGNDADRSFDGALGKGSGILLTQTSWLNKNLRSKKSLISIK